MKKRFGSILHSRKKFFLLLTILSGILLVSLFTFSFFTSTDKLFTKFTSQLFRQEVASSTLTLHYTLKEPEKFGLTDSPITFGNFSTDTVSYQAALENYLSFLNTMKPDRLSKENQITYDILVSYFQTALEGANFLLYEEPLGPVTGLQSQLPVLLSEYQFYDQKDVDTYLKLLLKLPDYFRSLTAFEKEKSDQGLFMCPQIASAVISECHSFVNMGNENYLFSTFEERLQDVKELDEKEKQMYLQLNEQYIKNAVFPAYRSLAQSLETMKSTGVNEIGVCQYPDGKAYYEYLLKRDIGTFRSVEELKALTQAQMLDDLNAMKSTLSGHSMNTQDIDTDSHSVAAFKNADPLNILQDLKSKSGSSFPKPPSVNVQVKYVPDTMEEYLSPAFYMIPAIDNQSENTIYINRGQTIDGIELFTTLAHEGYPGHLYQTTYFSSKNPAPIRSLFSCGGYTEGWATYTEMISYYYSPLSKQENTLLQKNKSLTLGLYALADIGIHYEGWNLEKMRSFFQTFGITDQKITQEIYDLIISDPGNYLKYYIGYLEFLELKKDAIASSKDSFTNLEFHRQILDIGPAPFSILRKYMRL